MTGRVRGWCPSLFEPMASGDGLLSRVKPPLGRIEGPVARRLAAAAQRFGNGQLELTNRGALQVRGLSDATLPAFREVVLAAGLASADPAVERRRTVIVSPLVSNAGAALAAEFEGWIAEDAALSALPPKFAFAVEAPGRDPRPLPGDIAVSPEGDGWRVRLAGCAISGLTHAPRATAQAVAHRFVALAAQLDDPPRRMADLVRRCGHQAIFAGADVTLEETALSPAATTAAVAGRVGGVFALGLAFGALTAEDLSLAAELAGRFGDGSLRTSPWRALFLPGVADPAPLAAAARAAGFVVDPRDPRRLVTACAGAPACANALAPTRADAALVAAQGVPGHVHLSGCPKGCAHPAPTAITLVAAPDGYGLVRGGRAGDAPEPRGLSLDHVLQLLAAEAAEIP